MHKYTDKEVEAADTRNYNWAHNALLGTVGMARSGMIRIATIQSATNETAELAMKIHTDLEKLATLVRKRRNPNGTITDLGKTPGEIAQEKLANGDLS